MDLDTRLSEMTFLIFLILTAISDFWHLVYDYIISMIVIEPLKTYQVVYVRCTSHDQGFSETHIEFAIRTWLI